MSFVSPLSPAPSLDKTLRTSLPRTVSHAPWMGSLDVGCGAGILSEVRTLQLVLRGQSTVHYEPPNKDHLKKSPTILMNISSLCKWKYRYSCWFTSLVPRRPRKYVWLIACTEAVQPHCTVRPNQIAEQCHVIFVITTNLILPFQPWCGAARSG